MLQDTIVQNQPEPHEAVESVHLLPRGERRLANEIDFSNVNITQEELTSKLACYNMVVEVHNNNIASRNLLVRHLLESMLDTKALNDFTIPLCFREVDDDLAVNHDEVETPLD